MSQHSTFAPQFFRDGKSYPADGYPLASSETANFSILFDIPRNAIGLRLHTLGGNSIPISDVQVLSERQKRATALACRSPRVRVPAYRHGVWGLIDAAQGGPDRGGAGRRTGRHAD